MRKINDLRGHISQLSEQTTAAEQAAKTSIKEYKKAELSQYIGNGFKTLTKMEQKDQESTGKTITQVTHF